MKKQLSDEQLDTLLRKLLNDTAADDATISEIANSPKIWWDVQRNISSQRAATLSAWPPVGKALRWLMVGVPVAAALVISFFVFRPAETTNNIADSMTMPVSTEIVNMPSSAPVSEPPSVLSKTDQDRPKSARSEALTVKINSKANKHKAQKPEGGPATSTKSSAEIKTDFIALSYARDPESGQIVRVKVPSSMMVSLGLVVSVEKPSDLVDAEVLVGDDGLTRAIRFIR